jgi:hypothetical protein
MPDAFYAEIYCRKVDQHLFEEPGDDIFDTVGARASWSGGKPWHPHPATLQLPSP